MYRCISIFSLLVVISGIAWGTETSTAGDQESIAVTVYNNGLGLVREARNLELPKGVNELRFMDVAQQIDATSVHIKSLTAPDKLSVLEQNYEYDLLEPNKLLDKYVGKRIKLLYYNPYTDREELKTAEFLSNNSGRIFRIGKEIHINPGAKVILPEIPENLIAKPTLVWMLDNNVKGPQKIEASYLTNGMSWRADYVVVLDKTDKLADLSGWVTITNNSGGTFRNANLKLVAGDVQRVQEEIRGRYTGGRTKLKAAMAGERFEEESFFEYHLYTLQRPSTVKDKQTKQISLLEAAEIPVKKLLIFRGQTHFYRQMLGGPLTNQKVSTYLEIANKKENNLGMPLPKGRVRAYKADKSGSLQFIGEDNIDHTPKNEKIKIKMGESFDVVAERKQMDWKKIASSIYESEWEISLRNHKNEDVEVIIEEPVQGDWQVLKSSHQYKKYDAHTLKFIVKVPKDKETKISYRVRVKY
ncbi:DUF4139 domain-containing protein [Candidatus Hydrogenedentota bacterium]